MRTRRGTREKTHQGLVRKRKRQEAEHKAGAEAEAEAKGISVPGATLTDPLLQDGFKAANAWVGHGIAWLDELQQFYRDRAAIEKEYSAKLDALAKKYFEKKNKKVSQLSVGDTPTLTPGSLER